MDFQWHQLSAQKFRFQTALFSDTQLGKRFYRLQHQYMLIAVAPFGGQIAVTSDKTKILTLRQDDPSIKNIVIYNNDGEIHEMVQIKDPFRNVITHIGFIQDQFLLVIFQKGQEWIIDPYNGTKKKFMIKGIHEGQDIAQAKIFQNGFAILTSLKRFLFVRNAFQPQCVEFASCEQQLKSADAALHWTVFSPKLIISEKVQLHLAHPTAGIVQIVENEAKKYFYNHSKGDHIIESKLPNIKGIRFISELSPNKKYIAYFSAEPLFKENPMDQIPQAIKKKKVKGAAPQAQKLPYGFAYRLIVAPSLTSQSVRAEAFKFFELPFVKANHLNQKGQPTSIVWCGNKAIIIQFANQEIYLYSVQGDYVRIQKQRSQKEKWSLLCQQVDGVRILSKRENKIIRQIPLSYISIFESFSQQPGAALYSAYQAFQDEAPLQDDQIRKDKPKLGVAVQQCIKAARFQLKFQTISKLMKAATYGKAFLPSNLIPNSIVYQTIKFLRIVYQMRQKGRFITVDQFAALSDERLLKILLRHRAHYFAFQIYNYLKKDQSFRVKVYTDWACCKVQNIELTQDQICREIKNKLENEKGISFTQIAHKSIEIGRSDLALKLLQFEPSLSKKVPLLLWIGNQQSLEKCYKFYQTGLQDALRSRDLNLLFLVIRKILTSEKLSEFEVSEMFSKYKQGVYALINYYRLFDGVALVNYYKYLNDNDSLLVEYLRRGFQDRKYENNQKLFHAALELIKSPQLFSKEDWRRQTMRKLYDHFAQFINHNPNILYKNPKIKPVTIAKQMQVFIARADADAVDQMKKLYKIPDRRAIMTKIKVLIDQSKWQDLQNFVDKHQKKFNLPVELIADMVLQRREQTWGMRMMARMPTKMKEQQYTLLQRIGRIKEAINLAYDRKDTETLEEIQETLIDAELIAYLNQKLTLLRRK